ncbi:DUF2500 domain-containing protein [Luteococcus peritonei]|uniref:DUF2500 domain-containing protein n=1 Tax=Luteococcus peritonei TaxID=88874 RepID=A0ABW4RYI8_9ACTN
MDPTDPFGNDPSGLDPTGGGFFSDFPDLFTGFGALGTVMALFFVVVFALVVGNLLWRGGRYVAARPQSAPAVCVARRMEVRGSAGTGDLTSSSTTWYHATFEFADGSRPELDLSGRAYGLLAEGDRGLLTWRDTVFKGLERDLPALGGPVG